MESKLARYSATIRNFTVFLVLVLLTWQFLVPMFRVPEYVLPVPTVIAGTMVDTFPFLVQNAVPTIFEIVAGFMVSLVLGLAMGIALMQSKVVRDTLYPALIVISSIPRVAIAPVIIVWLGFGTTSTIAIAFLIAFFPIVVNTMVGLNNVPTELIDLVRTMTKSKTKEFFNVRLHSALPYIFAGMKTSITLSAIGAIVAEFISSQQGLGYLLILANSQLKVPLMFAALFFLVVATLALYFAIVVGERLLVPWKTSTQV